jgi:hypothetical protein
MTIHGSNSVASFSSGDLFPNGNGNFSGAAFQYFSDRLNGSQIFDINQHDFLQYDLSSTGRLHIHYEPDNFDTSWDMSCQGGFLTARPNGGVVTLTIN